MVLCWRRHGRVGRCQNYRGMPRVDLMRGIPVFAGRGTDRLEFVLPSTMGTSDPSSVRACGAKGMGGQDLFPASSQPASLVVCCARLRKKLPSNNPFPHCYRLHTSTCKNIWPVRERQMFFCATLSKVATRRYFSPRRKAFGLPVSKCLHQLGEYRMRWSRQRRVFSAEIRAPDWNHGAFLVLTMSCQLSKMYMTDTNELQAPISPFTRTPREEEIPHRLGAQRNSCDVHRSFL
jgi:hypothetical protein